MTQTRPADPLVWGHGPRVFEAFLEPTCPYSVLAFGKLDVERHEQQRPGQRSEDGDGQHAVLFLP